MTTGGPAHPESVEGRAGPAAKLEECSAAPQAQDERAPLLFAQNLFRPEDLGGSRYPVEVVRRLAARGYPVTVATARLPGLYPDLPGARYALYPVSRPHPLLTHTTHVLGATIRLRSQRRTAYTAAFAGSYDVALALDLAGVAACAPLLFLYHSEFYSEWVQALGRGPRATARRAIHAYMVLVERRVFARSARIVAVSEFSAGQIRTRAPAAASKVRVIPTGVDSTFFAPPSDRAAARGDAGRPEGGALLLGVGRLAGVKQFDRLVAALARVRAAGVDARLVIAGDGPERPRLERLADELGVRPYLALPGFRDDAALRALMQAADLQVCSSAFENFSLAILEGMACGTPVLGTPGGGTPELVGAVDPALVLPDDTPESIANGILAALADRARQRDLGRRARALVVDRYDWERVVDRLEALVDEVSRG